MIRSVDFLSQIEAELLPGRPLQSNVAMISISTPGDRAPILADFKHMIQLEFHDVEYDDGGGWVLFTAAHAKQIVDFVGRLHADDESLDVIVHCKAGISRSAAVALFVQARSQCAMCRRKLTRFANRRVIRLLEQASGQEISVPRSRTSKADDL